VPVEEQGSFVTVQEWDSGQQALHHRSAPPHGPANAIEATNAIAKNNPIIILIFFFMEITSF